MPDLMQRVDLKGASLTGDAAVREPILWLQAGLTLAIFTIFWAWHARVSPFCFTFQNRLEHFLFFCSFTIVLLAMAYTFPEERMLVVEVLLTR